jgi:hypothetical protein
MRRCLQSPAGDSSQRMALAGVVPKLSHHQLWGPNTQHLESQEINPFSLVIY